MFRNKKLLLLLLSCLMLTGCASESQDDTEPGAEELLLDALESAGEAQNVQTAVVEKKDLTEEYVIKAQRLFPCSQNIVYENEYATVTFVECLAEKGEFVTAGQELFVLRQSMSEIDEKEVQLTYARENTAYETQCGDYERRLLELDEASGAYSSLLYEYEIYQKKTKQRLSELSEQIEAYDQIRENPEIILTAPFDGYVNAVIDRTEGEQVFSSDTLMQLQNTAVWYYTLEDTAQSIPIGKDVRLYTDAEEGQAIEITGSVICTDIVLSSEHMTKNGYALVYPAQVTIDGEDVTEAFSPSMLPETMDVELRQMELRNVLTVPREYVHYEEEHDYVYRLEDGVKVKTYVVCAVYSVNGSSWILSGVDEGDILVLN